MRAQRRHHAEGIRAPHLPRRDRLARLDEFIAGGNHGDARLAADTDTRHPGRRGNRALRCAEARAGAEEQRALARIGSAPVHIGAGCRCAGGGEACHAAIERDALDRHDEIATFRQHRAGHHLDARVGCGERKRRVACRLHALDTELPAPRAQQLCRTRDAIHRHAVERRRVALGIDVLAQHRTRALRERQ